MSEGDTLENMLENFQNNDIDLVIFSCLKSEFFEFSNFEYKRKLKKVKLLKSKFIRMLKSIHKKKSYKKLR